MMKTINRILIINYFLITSLSGITPTNTSDMYNVFFDAKTHALGGTHLVQSMSLHDVITLNSYHTKNKILFSYLNQFSGINYMNISYVIKDTDSQKIGLSLVTRSIDDFHTGGFIDTNGDEIPQLNEINYSDIDYYNHREYNFILMKSMIKNGKSFGFKFKTNLTSVYQSKAYGLSVDFGAQGQINSLGYGILINNAFSYKYWDTGQSYWTRPSIIFAGSYTKNKAKVFLDLRIQNINSFNELDILNAVGLDFSIAKNFNIRIGKTSLKSIVLGFGFTTDTVEINYAYNPNLFDNMFGQAHQISILLTLSKLEKIKEVILP